MSTDVPGHDVLLWENPPGGRTIRGYVLPPGWVWTCSCKGKGSSGHGFTTEEAANEAAEWHLLPFRQGEADGGH